MIEKKWVDGLYTPKGMRTHDGTLWVSDWVEGDMFRVNSRGDAEKILDLDRGTADIGYMHEEDTLLVPQNQKEKDHCVQNWFSQLIPSACRRGAATVRKRVLKQTT